LKIKQTKLHCDNCHNEKPIKHYHFHKHINDRCEKCGSRYIDLGDVIAVLSLFILAMIDSFLGLFIKKENKTDARFYMDQKTKQYKIEKDA